MKSGTTRRWTRVAGGVAWAMSLGLGAGAAEPGGEALSAARASVEAWIENEHAAAELEREWAGEQRLLEDLNAVLEEEAGRLEKAVEGRRGERTSTEESRANLLAEQGDLDRVAKAVAAALVELEGEVRRLHPGWPPPLQERVAPLMDRLGGAVSDGDMEVPSPGPARRLQALVGILVLAEKFDSDITLEQAVVEVPGGSKRQVKRLYIGLGQAYFTDASGTYVGTGKPGSKGWTWTVDPALAAAVEELFSVYEHPHRAAFVTLPASASRAGTTADAGDPATP